MSQCLKWVCRGRSLCCKGVSWLLGFYFLHTNLSWFGGVPSSLFCLNTRISLPSQNHHSETQGKLCSMNTDNK